MHSSMILRHLVRKEKQPFDIMCYNVDEKRNVRIKYKDIRVKKSCNSEEFVFSDLDKIYHILSYAIRCAIEGQEELIDKVEIFLEYIWKRDSRGGSIYQRCIKKKVGQSKDFSTLYQNMSSINMKDKKFFENVFSYLAVAQLQEQGNEIPYQYYSFL